MFTYYLTIGNNHLQEGLQNKKEQGEGHAKNNKTMKVKKEKKKKKDKLELEKCEVKMMVLWVKSMLLKEKNWVQKTIMRPQNSFFLKLSQNKLFWTTKYWHQVFPI